MFEINISAKQVKSFRGDLHVLKQIVNKTLLDSLIFLFQLDVGLKHLFQSYIFIEVMLVGDNVMEKYNKKFLNYTSSI